MCAKANTREATIEDLYRIEGQAELVNGEIVRMPLHVEGVVRAIGRAKMSLLDYAEEGKGTRGFPSGSKVAYVVDLPHRKAFCPDLAYSTNTEHSMKFPVGAPIFVAEFRDPDNYGPAAERAIADKISDYFAAGTQVVWDVNLQSNDVVRVFRKDSPDEPIIYRRGETAEAEPALPGWTMPIDDLFL